MNWRWRRGAVAAAALVLGLWFSRALWLAALGRFLVHDEAPARTEAAIVLGGDFHGMRAAHAANLARRQFFPKIFLSGGVAIYGVNEADLAYRYAIEQGFPAALFEPVRVTATSTREECEALRGEMEKRGLRRITIVTSDYHSARALRTCRAAFGPGFELRAAAAPDKYFQAGSWWKSREGRKTAFLEYAKTIASWIGL